MGSGTSTPQQQQQQHHGPLKCPEGFDPDKFRRLCVMFDSLDRDSDMAVSAEETVHISEGYIRERIESLKKQQESIQREMEHDHAVAEQERGRAGARLRQDYDDAVGSANAEYEAAVKAAKQAHESALREAEETYNAESARADAAMAAKKQRSTLEHGDELGRTTGRLEWYSTMAPEDKGRAFIKAMCGDGDASVGFWRFFEFMKTRI